MAFTFPTSPTDGQTVLQGTTSFTYSTAKDAWTGTTASTVTTSVSSGNRATTFTSNGTWTVPDGVTSAKVTITGGGGAGGDAFSSFEGTSANGSGGGAGGTAITYLKLLEAGKTINVTVGAGGLPATLNENSNANGNPGTPSSITPGTQSLFGLATDNTNVTAFTISGQGGGAGYYMGNGIALGGTATNGQLNISGGTSSIGGIGGGSYWGGGGAHWPGLAYGSGGGGALAVGGTGVIQGKSGAPGIVVFEYQE